MITTKLWIVSFIYGMPCFCVGLALASMNSCLVLGDDNDAKKCYNGEDDSCPRGTIYNDLDLSPLKAQIATALGILGAWIGSLFGSKPSEKYGRRQTLIYNNFFFFVGGALAAAGNEYTLYVGRLILGFGAGIGSAVCPVIYNEICAPEDRGIIGAMYQASLVFGIFIVAFVAFGFVTYVDNGWQFVQGFIFIPSTIMLIGAPLLPESPKWLIQMKRDAEATKVVADLRTDDHDVEEEISAIQSEIKQKESTLIDSSTDNDKEITWSDVFKAREAVIVGVGLMFISAMTGINTVIFYSTTIFGFAGFDEQILATASVGFINLIFTFVGMYFADRTGRKILLLSSLVIMLFSLLLLSIILLLPGVDDTAQGYVAVFACLSFVAGFSIGLGPVCWVVMSEMLPTRLRTKAFGLFLSVNWGANLVIAMVTLTTIDLLGGVESDMDDDDEIAGREKSGVAYLYLIMSGITVCSILFIQYFVPETKGKTPEQLQGLNTPLLLAMENDDKLS